MRIILQNNRGNEKLFSLEKRIKKLELFDYISYRVTDEQIEIDIRPIPLQRAIEQMQLMALLCAFESDRPL
jgi:hypothetical protein